MAQKKKKEPEVKEDYNFVPPDFNEREFLEKDMAVTKTVLFSALLAVLIGVVAYLTTSISFVIGLLIIVIGAFSLRYIFKVFPIDISMVENKTWIGNGALTFFLALGIWILLLNPPFGDSVDPQIDNFQAWVGDNQTLLTDLPVSTTIIFNVTVTDNGNLASVEYSLTDLSSNTVISTGAMNLTDDNLYEFSWTFSDSSSGINYKVVITAIDDSGNENSLTKSLYVP